MARDEIYDGVISLFFRVTKFNLFWGVLRMVFFGV